MTVAGPVAAVSVLAAFVVGRAGLAACRRSGPARRARALVATPGPGAGRHLPGAPPWLGARLHEVGSTLPPDAAWRRWAAGAVLAVGLAVAAAGPAAGALAALAVLAAPCLAWQLLRHRGAAAVEAALPAAVEAMATALRSGASLRQALAEAAGVTPGTLGADLAGVADATRHGSGVVAALEAWAGRRPLPGVRLVVAALCLAAETGGAAARSVDAVAATLRQRLAAQAEARALATQARVSAAVIAVAPVAFCVLSVAVDPRSSAFLLRTRVGLALLTAGLVLDAAGALWMARLTRIEV